MEEDRKVRIVSDTRNVIDIYTVIRITFWVIIVCFGLAIGAGYYYFLSGF